MDSMFEYKPENKFAGEFPVVTEIATAGEDIKKMTPVTMKNGEIFSVTTETTENIVGLAVENAESKKEALYYATGEFQINAIVLPDGVTVEKIKPIMAKNNIYLR